MANFRPLFQTAAALLLAGTLSVANAAGLLEHEVSFSEAEIQAAVERNGPLSRSYGGIATVALQQAPKIALGVPEGRIGLAGSMQVNLAGQPAIPVDVQGFAGIRYDDRSKAFFLENPVTTSVNSPMLQKSTEPFVKQGINQLMNTYFRNRPVYVLRSNGSAEELAARWLLRSIRIEAGRVVAILSPL